jgi:hypothetical protein
LLGGTLGNALVKFFALSLEQRHSCRIRVAWPNVQSLSVLTGQVGVDQGKVPVEAFVDWRGGRPTAPAKDDQAQR